MTMNKTILLGHGSGGKLSSDLIRDVFIKHFDNEILSNQYDSSIFDVEKGKICITTDSFVVNPIFFPGGNIGTIAVAGTVNDLAVSGAIPKYLTSAFIIEEGFLLEELELIVKTMADEARNAGVLIIAGDTKVVERGSCDKIFINTTGIGFLSEENKDIGSGKTIEPEDVILLNGSIADHGMCIMAERNNLKLNAKIESDCACLNGIIQRILEASIDVKFMRDATRGGISTVLYELVHNRNIGIEIHEDKIPVKENVQGMCELLGFDPFYVANEGKFIVVVAKVDAQKALQIMLDHPLGKDSAIIGNFTTAHPGKGWIHTSVGGKRIVDMLAGEQLPRIC